MEERPWHAHYAGIPTTIEYERLTVPEFLDRSAEHVPDNVALRFLDRKLTYAELHEAVERLATAFVELGVKPGERIAIQGPNIPQTVIAYYAALRMGAQVVLTNPLYTAREIEHQWNDSGCVLVVTMDFLWKPLIEPLRASLPTVRHYVLAAIPEYLGWPKRWLAQLALSRREPPRFARITPTDTVHRFKPLIDGTPRTPPDWRNDWNATALLQYTGGTTGVSKGAMLSHANLSINVQQTNHWFGGDVFQGEVLLSALPLFHVFGMTVCMNWGFFQGATVVLLPDPRNVEALVGAIAKFKVTLFPAVPAMFNSICNHPGVENFDLTSVKSCFSGSAPIAPELLRRFEKLTGARILEGYGMSETSPVTHVNPLHGERRIGSVGIPVPDTDARVVDVEDGTRVLGPGEEGELCMRGPQVMSGYWNQPEETAKTLRDGWLFSGDLAVMDEDGYFKIVGRKKDMINFGGLKIFPDEVDSVLVSHDAILEAATIGIPCEKRGEIPKSFIVLKPGKSLDIEELRTWCRDLLAPYKIPREVEILDELPKSTVLKVLRRELRDRELARLHPARTA